MRALRLLCRTYGARADQASADNLDETEIGGGELRARTQLWIFQRWIGAGAIESRWAVAGGSR